MALDAFATINISSAVIVNNHKYARGGRRDFLTPSVMVGKTGTATLRLAERTSGAARITLYYIYLYFRYQQPRPRCGRESKAGGQSHLCHTAEGKWDMEGWLQN